MADTTRGWMRVIADAVDPGNPGMRNDNEPGYFERIAAGIGSLSPSNAPTLAEVQALIPQPANVTPRNEMTGGAIGAQVARFALEDHQHPRLTSTTYATLASDGSATVTFTRPFTNKPGITMTETDVAGKQPLICAVQSWVQDANNRYTGCVIKGQRAQVLPTINPLSGVLTLLTAVVSGVNGIVGQLTNYNVFGGTVDGAIVSVIAVARSDVSAA